MVNDQALIHNTQRLEDFIGHDASEQPLVIQLGGSDPTDLGKAAKLCEEFGGFEAINLNCGCPSDKAKKAGFGAELMLDPELVSKILTEMKRCVSRTDVTVKCRLGVTGRGTFENLVEFTHAVSRSGVRHMIVHARHCVLCGLNPAQNRSIPPLKYEWVHRLAGLFPEMKFELNGGITSFKDAIDQLGDAYPLREQNDGLNVTMPTSSSLVESMNTNKSDSVDNSNSSEYLFNTSGTESTRQYGSVQGVMIGREAYNNPFSFAHADSLFFHREDQCKSRRDILESFLDVSGRNKNYSSHEMITYSYLLYASFIHFMLQYAVDAQESGMAGSATCKIVKPMHNFFSHQECNKAYKQSLDGYIKMHGQVIRKSRKGIVGLNQDSGKILNVKEMVWAAVNETVPSSVLDKYD